MCERVEACVEFCLCWRFSWYCFSCRVKMVVNDFTALLLYNYDLKLHSEGYD